MTTGDAQPRPTVAPGTPEDDVAVRALLREQPLGGAVRLSLEREPDTALAAAAEGDRRTLLVARGEDGAVLACGQRTVRELWLDGKRVRVGYLGMLRRHPSLAGRVRLLADAFALLERTRQPDELRFDLTSIVTDNAPARRLLERGARGLPIYEPVARFATLVLPVPMRPPAPTADLAGERDMPEVVTCHGAIARNLSFATVLDEATLRSSSRCPGLTPSDFTVLRENGRVVGCAALWDQRGFKQVVVRGYDRATALLRTPHNLAAPILRRPRLPALNEAFNLGCVALLAARAPADAARLIGSLFTLARRRGLDTLCAGFNAEDPALPAVRRAWGGVVYHSLIHAVRPLHEPPVLPMLGERPVSMEVALL